jgi:hypothetical protein
MKRAILVIVGLLALVGAAHAQILTGRIIGAVRDESGAVLPGVTVTLTSPALPAGPQTVVTNERGEYRFTELTPGSYDLEASLQGFTKYHEAGLQVVVSGTIERIVGLKVGALEETITVSGESPMVDPRRVGTSVNIPQETLEVLPIARFRASELAKWSPGVTPTSIGTSTDNLAVMGSANAENSVIYDGSLNKAPDDGRALQAGQADVIQEVQVVTLGASAEYQVAQGAVINLIYKSGTNNFKYDMSGYWYPDALISKPIERPCNCPLGETGFIQGLNQDYAADAGGPILRDRLWYFGGFKFNRRESSNPGTNPDFAPLWFGHGVMGKLTWQVNDKVKLRQSWSSTFWDTPAALTITRPIETITKSPGASHLYVSEATALLSNRTLLTARATGMYSPVPIGYPETGDTSTSYRVNTTTGIACCGVQNFGGQNLGRHGVAAKLNHYAEFGATTHDFGAGLQYERGYYHSYRTLPNGVNYSDLNGQPNQATFRDPYVQGAEYTAPGVWAEDKITFGSRLTVSVGLRFDQMKGISPDEPVRNTSLDETGQTVAGRGDMFTWHALAPRTGFNYKLTNDGKTILRGAFGRAYRQILTNDFVGVHPGLSPTTLMRWNPATNSYSTFISVTDPTANIAVDPDLKAPYTDSYSVGVDRELMKGLGLGISYVHKEGRNQIGWRDIGGIYGTRTDTLPDGRLLTVLPLLNATSARKFLRTNAPGGYMTYDGVVFTLERRFSNRWRANFAYTRSRSEGLVTTQQDPNGSINTAGLQDFDRPNMILMTSAYDVPRIDVFLAVDLMSASGTTFAPQAQVQLPQGTQSVNIEPPDGTYRLPFENILSLRVTKMLFRQGARRMELGMEIRNLLQDTAYENITTANFYTPTFGQGSTWADPRRMVLFMRWYY